MRGCELRWSSRALACRYLLCALLIMAVWSSPLSSAAGAATRANNLLVMGDSLSAGYGINVNRGWVALLKQRLKIQGYGVEVINASVSGETTSGGHARLPALLREHQPRIVIIELGANDGLRGLPVKQMRRNLAAMIASSQAQGAQVVLLGMQLPGNYGPAYTRSFADCYAGLAREFHLSWTAFFLDGVALNPALMQADNLHPNESAQARLLENVWTILFPLLKKSLIKK